MLTSEAGKDTLLFVVYPEKISKFAARAATRTRRTENDAEGVAVNFKCGSYLRLFLTIDNGGLVGAVDIRSNGCGFMLAAADVLSEYVTGRSLTELHGLRRDELGAAISTVLGEMPSDRSDCATSAIEALRAAFIDLRSRRVEEFRGEEPLICTCFGVTETRIAKIIDDFSLMTVEEVGDACRAGRGCGSCLMLIEEMLEHHAAGSLDQR